MTLWLTFYRHEGESTERYICQENLAVFCIRRKQYRQAITHLDAVLSFRQTTSGDLHPDLLPILHSLGFVYMQKVRNTRRFVHYHHFFLNFRFSINFKKHKIFMKEDFKLHSMCTHRPTWKWRCFRMGLVTLFSNKGNTRYDLYVEYFIFWFFILYILDCTRRLFTFPNVDVAIVPGRS